MPYASDWSPKVKQKVLERDGYKCQNPFCDETINSKLDIHHINYDKMNCDSTNLISLCKICHSYTTNNDRDSWEIFYETIIINNRL